MSGQGQTISHGIRWSLAPCYQFYGSEGTLIKVEDVNQAGRYLPIGNWTLVQPYIETGTVKFKPRALVSSIRAYADIPSQANPYTPDPYLVLRPAHQPDGLGVTRWTCGSRPIPFLTTPWAEPTPYHGAYRISGSFVQLPQATDQKYDVAPTLFRSKLGLPQVPDTDWYRGGCVQTIVDPTYGTKQFIVMVDVAHRFWCYPTDVQIEPFSPDYATGNKANVEAKYVRSQLAPLPTWVTPFNVGKTSTDSLSTQFNHIQPKWVFSPLGNKAAAIFFHRDEAWQDSFYTSACYDGSTKLHDVQEDYPGLIEVSLVITLTGPKREDFSFAVVLLDNQYSKTTGKNYLAVGYAARPFVALGIQYADRLTLEQVMAIRSPFQLASDYDAPTLGYTVQTADAYVLKHPSVAAKTVVKKGDTIVLSWNSAYQTTWGRYDPFTADSCAKPKFDDLSDKPITGHTTVLQQFDFHTTINAMDLSTLSFVLGSSMTLTGWNEFGSETSYPSLYLKQWACPATASAAMVTIYSQGVIESQTKIGHTQLKNEIANTLDVARTNVPWASMNEIDLTATANSVAFTPDFDEFDGIYADLWKTYRYAILSETELEHPRNQHQFANITINYGISKPSVTKKVIHTMHYGGDSVDSFAFPMKAIPEFDDAYHVLVPRLFTMFDAGWRIRPGIRFTNKLWSVVHHGWIENREGNEIDGYTDVIVEPGDTSYSGYPLGAILHSRCAVQTLNGLNYPYASLSTSPNGSYAVFFGPFAAATSTIETHPDENTAMALLDASVIPKIEQAVVDEIKIGLILNNNIVYSKTTHIAMMNEVFGTTLTPADYHFRFAISGGELMLSPHKTYAPDVLDPWRIHHRYDLGLQTYDGETYDGAALFAPMAMGWSKHTWISQSFDAMFPNILSCFHGADLVASSEAPMVAWPTPRMEGLFSAMSLPYGTYPV